MKNKTLCFIDDDPYELSRFNNAMINHYEVITGLNYKDCKDQLEKKKFKKPDLWVLDLFFPRNGITNTSEQLFEMNQRYHQLSESIRNFRSYLEEIGQGSGGGLELLEKCKESGVPVVFLTRKGTLDDAIQCRDKGAERVLKKPMPSDWPTDNDKVKDALDQAMLDGSPKLIDYFEDVISKYSHWNRYKHYYMLIVGSLIGLILESVFDLIKNLLSSIF